MKEIKNILLIILIVYGLGMTVFANLKANEAEKQKQVAAQQEIMAIEASAEARKAEAEAIMAKNEAEMQRELALKALENCN